MYFMKGNAIMVIYKKVLLATVLSFIGLQMYGVGGPSSGVVKKLVLASQAKGSQEDSAVVTPTSITGIGTLPTSGFFIGFGSDSVYGVVATIQDTSGNSYTATIPANDWYYYPLDAAVASFSLQIGSNTALNVSSWNVTNPAFNIDASTSAASGISATENSGAE